MKLFKRNNKKENNINTTKTIDNKNYRVTYTVYQLSGKGGAIRLVEEMNAEQLWVLKMDCMYTSIEKVEEI